jgi:hypothetical protein
VHLARLLHLGEIVDRGRRPVGEQCHRVFNLSGAADALGALAVRHR